MDAEWLRSIGVEGSITELSELEESIAAALELRVGSAVAEKLTAAQIDEFEDMMEHNVDEDVRLSWLENIYPGYKHEVDAETKRLEQGILRSENPATYIRSL